MPRARFHRFRSWLDLEKSIGLGVGIFLLGVVLSFVSVWQWRDAGFGSLDPADSVRSAVPAVLGLVLGNQTVLFGLFLSFLRIRVVRPAPEVPVEDPTLRPGSAEPAADQVGERLLGEVAADADAPARGSLRG